MCFAELYIVLFSVMGTQWGCCFKRHIYFGWQSYEDNDHVQYTYIYICNIQIPCSSVLLIVFFTGGSSITMRIVKFLKIIFSKTMQERIVIIITTTIHIVRLLDFIILSIFSETQAITDFKKAEVWIKLFFVEKPRNSHLIYFTFLGIHWLSICLIWGSSKWYLQLLNPNLNLETFF